MNSPQKRVFQFFGLTFLISWALWSPYYFNPDLSEFWALPGAWGPTLAALMLTWMHEGKRGVRRLFAKLKIWRVPVKYYAFAILGILGVGLLSLLTYRAATGHWMDTAVVLQGMGLSPDQWILGVALSPLFFVINTLLGGPIAEELGWRGYAQGRMQGFLTPNQTGLAIGFLWSLWHLPLFYFLPQGVGHMPILPYFISMMAMGVIFSWFYNQTKGSVLLAILLHGGMNFAEGFLGADLLQDDTLRTIHIILIAILALVVSRKNKSIAPA